MKRIIPAFIIVACVAIAFQFLPNNPVGLFTGQVAKAKKDVKIQVLNDNNFEQTLKDSKTIVVVDYYATWCGPCKKIAPAIQDLANKYDGKVLVVKVDVDKSPQTASDQAIGSMPTVKVYAPGGKLLDTKIGAALGRDTRTGQWIWYDVTDYEKFIAPYMPKDKK